MAIERKPEGEASLLENVRVERCVGLLSIFLGKERIDIAYLKSGELVSLGVDNKPSVDELAKQVQVVNLPDGILLFSGTLQTATLENPIKMSPNSDAKYLAKLQTDEYLFLYQYLEGHTSRHMHPGEGELFIPQDEANPSFVHNSSIDVIRDTLWLPPDTYHEAFSYNRPTMTAIVQSADVEHSHDPSGRTPLDVLHLKLEDHLARLS